MSHCLWLTFCIWHVSPGDVQELAALTNAYSACVLELRAFHFSCFLVAEAKWLNHSLNSDVWHAEDRDDTHILAFSIFTCMKLNLKQWENLFSLDFTVSQVEVFEGTQISNVGGNSYLKIDFSLSIAALSDSSTYAHQPHRQKHFLGFRKDSAESEDECSFQPWTSPIIICLWWKNHYLWSRGGFIPQWGIKKNSSGGEGNIKWENRRERGEEKKEHKADVVWSHFLLFSLCSLISELSKCLINFYI